MLEDDMSMGHDSPNLLAFNYYQLTVLFIKTKKLLDQSLPYNLKHPDSIDHNMSCSSSQTLKGILKQRSSYGNSFSSDKSQRKVQFVSDYKVRRIIMNLK
ncbi:hypothetical protein pb186bvf_005846 [Paramecium bursaria]